MSLLPVSLIILTKKYLSPDDHYGVRVALRLGSIDTSYYDGR